MTGVEKSNNYSVKQTNKSSSSNTDFASYLGETKSLDSIFENAAKKYNVPENLLKAIGKAESNFNDKAVSRCGAQGVMQLMPKTAKSLGVTDSLDAEQNIMGGAKYISGLLKKYDGDTKLALAAYNAGSGNVAKYNGIPPFKETQNYVKKVIKYYDQGVDKSETKGKTSTVKVNRSVEVNPVVAANNSEAVTPAVNTTAGSATVSSISSDVNGEISLQEKMDSVFSYEDYMNFLFKYLEDAKDSEENAKEKVSDSMLSSINYNVPVMNLMKSIN